MDEGPRSAPLEILLVEDNPADVRMAREALKIVGVPHRLQVVEDGEQALAYVRREGAYADRAAPDLMLLDLTLPRLGGHDVLEAMRRDPSIPRIPVVVLTGSKLEKDIRRSFELHADEHLTKPVGLMELAAEMMFALNVLRARANPA